MGSRHTGSRPGEREGPPDDARGRRGGSRKQHRGRRRPRVALAALVVLAVLAALPPVRDRVTAAVLLTEAVGVEVPRPFAADVQRSEIQVDGVPADLYDAGDDAETMLLVPGAAPAGRDDPRVVRLATALARSEVTVLVPELELYRHRFDQRDLDLLVAAVRHLAGRDPSAEVTLLGISFGGSFALLTAADSRVRDVVGAVATFGAYADMVGMIQAAATGVSVVAGERYPWEPPEETELLLRRVAVELTPREQREELTTAFAIGAADFLPPEARTAYQLATADDPQAVEALVARLPEPARDQLDTFSPAAVADQVDAEVLALHSRDDPAVPYAELLRLGRAFPDADTYTVSSFEHVDLRAEDLSVQLVSDLWTTWRFAGDVLGAGGR